MPLDVVLGDRHRDHKTRLYRARRKDLRNRVADLLLDTSINGHGSKFALGRETLAEYVAGPWADHLETLSQNTQAVYRHSYRLHIEPRLGRMSLRRLQRVERVREFQADLLRAGVGPSAIDKAMRVLGAILGRAEADERITANPMRKVRKSRPKPPEVRPVPPASVEALRAQLAKRKAGPHPQASRMPLAARDAIVVSILAYAGLRPQELRRLRWRDVAERTLRVNAESKTGGRSVRLLAPLKADLAEWRLACGRPAESEFVVPSERETATAEQIGQWTANGFEKWRARVFMPAVKAARLDLRRPYDLRHAFASLLANEGRSAIYIADQLGHGKGVSVEVYQHVIAEFEDAPRLPAEDAIRQAREQRARKLG